MENMENICADLPRNLFPGIHPRFVFLPASKKTAIFPGNVIKIKALPHGKSLTNASTPETVCSIS